MDKTKALSVDLTDTTAAVNNVVVLVAGGHVCKLHTFSFTNNLCLAFIARWCARLRAGVKTDA